jgi:uncharacterized damage-inducible protein DinB
MRTEAVSMQLRRCATRAGFVLLVLASLAFLSHSAFAETAPAPAEAGAADPLSAHNRRMYGGLKQMLLRSAELVPEEQYAFKPVESVRSFGQIVGHVADAQYMFCASVLGETAPRPQIEKTKTSKADLVSALRDAIAYCDRAYDPMTDAAGTEMVKAMGGEMPKLGVLTVNNLHSVEHYGNLVTYMRMNGLVPPTSDPEFMRSIRSK